MNVLLEARELDVRRGTRTVLRGVSLVLRPGELVMLVGPNGSGKSTLLQALIGALPVSHGQIRFRGRPWLELPVRERARQVALAGQDEHVPFALAVREVVSLGRLPHLRPFAAHGSRDEAAIDRALRVTDLTDLQDRDAARLSGGERARVHLARAIAQDTPVLLLDEPVAHLDLVHRFQVLELVERLANEGRAVLVVLHDLDLAVRYGHRLIVLDAGRVHATGVPPEALSSAVLREVFEVEGHLRVKEGRVEGLAARPLPGRTREEQPW